MEQRTYFGCRVKQRVAAETIAFFVFSVRVKDLRKWAGIRRIEDLPEGTQRVLRISRTHFVRRFFEANAINTIPNSVLLAFEPNKASFTPAPPLDKCLSPLDYSNGCGDQLTWGLLNFSYDPGDRAHDMPALIVDGQHRIYGMADYEQEDLPLLVVSMLDAPLVEQAFQFIVINDKAVSVPKTDAKSILANFLKDNEYDLRDRLLAAGVSYKDESPMLKEINDMETSPFRHMLDWGYNRDGEKIIPLTAIEQSIRFMRSFFSVLETDDDSLVEIFCAIWRAAKATYPELWSDRAKFLTKVNINALTEYLGQRLKVAWEFDLDGFDIFDPNLVERQSFRFLQAIPQEFWKASWTVTVQDNANVRQMIKDDLETMAGNFRAKRQWFDDLRLPRIH